MTSVVVVVLCGCYDSTWGQGKREQGHYIAHYTPPTLSGGEPDRAARSFSVQVWVTPAFVGQSTDWPKDVRDVVEGASAVLQGSGARLSISSMNVWSGA